jgi:hypothetical protein
MLSGPLPQPGNLGLWPHRQNVSDCVISARAEVIARRLDSVKGRSLISMLLVERHQGSRDRLWVYRAHQLANKLQLSSESASGGDATSSRDGVAEALIIDRYFRKL